jgi:serine/threonine-protein kinase Chk1
LPADLPFRIISKTIGRGAYASIKKAIPPDAANPVFAVKFIHKAYAMRVGRISAKQIAMEVSLHSHIGQHPNVIEWFATDENAVWRWIAMEYASGGDLFDKIEADKGVKEDIAHFYFSQLVSGVSFMHSKGVGHRDIKPENILLSETGDLKIADFGLATLFEYQGRRKQSTTLCGSPPYIAPEVITCSRSASDRSTTRGSGYSADLVDIWSCGVVLFVLLVGNTPWDEPTENSWEFQQYVKQNSLNADELWKKIPRDALSLLRGMLSIDPATRFSFEKIRRHPWYTRKNPLLGADGRVTDQLNLATAMLQNLHIDFSQQPAATRQRPGHRQVVRSSDEIPLSARISSTQPETPISDAFFDWERPTSRLSQPTDHSARIQYMPPISSLADEPSMSQFAAVPQVPLTLTQHARKFQDIVPAYSLTRFFSHVSANLLVPLLGTALHSLNVPTPSNTLNETRQANGHTVAIIRVRTKDERGWPLNGEILVEEYGSGDQGAELLEVRFVKIKGDPLEWRRFFKKVVVLCKDGVYVPA